jgi:hypothetical protein
MNKSTILWGIIILLAVLNMATIATILYNNQKKETHTCVMRDSEYMPLNGRCFRKIVGFDKEQMDVFRAYNKAFIAEANMIISEINIRKEIMFEELHTTNPDTLKLKNISVEIGELHAALKNITVKFYLAMKTISDDTQKKNLEKVFAPLFNDNQHLRNISQGDCEMGKNKNPKK